MYLLNVYNVTQVSDKDNGGDCLLLRASVGGQSKTDQWETKLSLLGQRRRLFFIWTDHLREEMVREKSHVHLVLSL